MVDRNLLTLPGIDAHGRAGSRLCTGPVQNSLKFCIDAYFYGAMLQARLPIGGRSRRQALGTSCC